MTPNLALTLSFDGIHVLHRSAGGWALLAEVPLDAPDLAERLAQARAAALALEPGGLRTTVMLPPEQVKVMEAAGPGAEAAREALRGATPYGLDELVIHHASAGGRNLVAAVARETLDEAEAFVAGHGFHPVGFAAELPGSGFDGEAAFGATRLAQASTAGVAADGAGREEPDPVPAVAIAAAQEAGRGFAEAPSRFDGQDAVAAPDPSSLAPEAPILVQAERVPLRAPARDAAGTLRPVARTAPAAERRSLGAAGLRMAAWMGGAPRAKGVILGAASIAAMLAVGVWASSVDGGANSLPQRDRAAAAIQVQPEATSAVVDQADAAPSIAGVPVSPSEAERVYASTGVWLRAPSLPDLPRADGIVLAVATAPDAAPPAAEAPDGLLVAAADEGPVAPALPPPSGSRPLARTGTSLSAASDVLVVAGRPAVVPPSRPDRVAPAPVLAAAEPPGRPAARPAAPELPATMQVLVEALPASAGGLPQALTAQALALLAAPPSALSFTDPAADLPSVSVARPPSRPGGLAPDTPETSVVLASFDGPRPGLRPAGLAPEAAEPPAEAVAEASEPAIDPAAVDAALAAAQQAAPVPAAPDVQTALASIVAGAPDPLAGATRQAVALASRPDARPRNFGSVVSAQLGRAAQAQSAAVAAAAPRSNAPEDVEANEPEVASSAAAAPSGATARSVAQAATFADAMALREVNLIGVFGQPGERRALVRMGNGRYLRVGVGDSLDGGRVTAIGDNALNYSKRGRQMQLVIPGA